MHPRHVPVYLRIHLIIMAVLTETKDLEIHLIERKNVIAEIKLFGTSTVKQTRKDCYEIKSIEL